MIIIESNVVFFSLCLQRLKPRRPVIGCERPASLSMRSYSKVNMRLFSQLKIPERNPRLRLIVPFVLSVFQTADSPLTSSG